MNYDVIIAGGGPAGSCAAALLSQQGARVLVLEEKHMPRHKVCGEFITSECLPVLSRLQVTTRLLDAGAQRLNQLRLVASSGKVIEATIAGMSRDGEPALSLSRARLDQILMERAREAGADYREGIAVRQCLYNGQRVCGVEAMSLADGRTIDFNAPILVDASGRNSRLMLKRDERAGGKRGARLYALKAHLDQVEEIKDQVELYFFPTGYGGLSRIEGGSVNLCFIASERAFKESGGDHLKIVRETIMQNRLARERLRNARVVGKWLSAGPLTFGARRLSQNGVLALGDASGMIDPFTGTGIQIALRTGEMAADSIIEALSGIRKDRGPANSAAAKYSMIDHIMDLYRARYADEFGRRMKVAEILRNAAFSPRVAHWLATLSGSFPLVAQKVLRATRS